MNSGMFIVTARPNAKTTSAVFKNLRVQVDRDLAGFARQSGEILLTFTKQQAPKRTGQFASRHRMMMKDKLNPLITAPDPLATFILHGTRPHWIRPRYKKALAFSMGGRNVVCRSVHHPGTRANDYLGRAYRQWKPIARELLKGRITSWKLNRL